MNCPNCHTDYPAGSAVCPRCGVPLIAAEKKNKLLIPLIAVSAVLLVLVTVLVTSAVLKHRDTALTPADPSAGSTLQPVTAETETAAATTAAPTAADAPLTTLPAATEPDWRNAPADRLYRPAESLFVDQYTAYVFCTDIEVQDYVKMRFGPSKITFNTVGVQIPNYEQVTVQTRSLNGWTLCYYQAYEGWIRSDFLFERLRDTEAFTSPRIPEDPVPQPGASTVCPGYYRVVSTGDFSALGATQEGDLPSVSRMGDREGWRLVMRDAPRRDAGAVYTLQEGSLVYVYEDTRMFNGWVYVVYDSMKGEPLEGYVYFACLQAMDDAGDKPVLYLYPKTKQTVSVRLRLSEDFHLSCAYPAYEDGWRVTASPDGTLVNTADGRTCGYLYWELAGKADYDFSTGFVVKGSDSAAFLEKSLAALGLTDREAGDFITYWLPLLQKNRYNLISFQSAAYTENCGLEITPAPDSILRVFMAYKPLKTPVSVPEQTLTPFTRTGFTAVEWGGACVE